MNIDLHKIYNFTPVTPPPDPLNLPTGGSLFYECKGCAVVLSSVPFIKCACDCGNMQGSGGKLAVNKPEEVHVMQGRLK